MARLDPHSCFDDSQPVTESIHWTASVDFDRRRLSGTARLRLASPAAEGPLDLDTKGLEIRAVRAGDGQTLSWDLGAEEPILGCRLRLNLPGGVEEVEIDYDASPDAVALQWLDPAQTAGKRYPYLFSQCQAIHARTILPCQDSPRVRVSYSAEVTVPEPLVAVMSAASTGWRAGPTGGTRTWLFVMPQPIPSYLLALAVGHLASRDVHPRCRVWAEPEVVEAAAHEFAEVGSMLERAETLFGPYEWDRYDMLVLPPSFPYGGMENPRLTFLTPTLLAGDRSLVDVVTHELAHSWTGNLVTNATMDHFWLNEGFTVWAERRILEALHGADAAAVAWAIGQKGMEGAFARFGFDSPLTKLRTDLEGVDPDEAYSQIPYEKGARFVVLLERHAGRERFDRFIRRYIERFRFCSITTEEFLAFLEQELPGAADAVGAREWLYEPGLPAGAPAFRSGTLERLESLGRDWAEDRRPDPSEARGWPAAHLLVFLQNLPRKLSREECAWLDRELSLTTRRNYEILVEWLTIAAGSGYEPVFERVREVLTSVGRMKYLRPLYQALGVDASTQALARAIFDEAKPGYHPLSRRVVESVIAGWPAVKGEASR